MDWEVFLCNDVCKGCGCDGCGCCLCCYEDFVVCDFIYLENVEVFGVGGVFLGILG